MKIFIKLYENIHTLITKFLYDANGILFNICILIWAMSIEPEINAIAHISEYEAILCASINGATRIYFLISLINILLNKKIFQNKLFFACSSVMFLTWAFFAFWDLVDFIKNPDLGYMLFALASPIYCLFSLSWVILCSHTVFNSNTECVKAV